MKNILKLCCILSALFCAAFPLWYFNGDENVKEIKISHILLDSQEEAVTLREEIKGGLNFGKAAEMYSKDETTKEEKGDLGYRGKYNLLETAVSDAAFKLKKYELSEPVQSSYGWHLIKVYDIVKFSDRSNFDERY